MTKSTKDDYQSRKAQVILGFLIEKGLLGGSSSHPKTEPRFKIADVLLVAEEVEPRILEVLPAAIIHYPNVFVDLENLPNELKQIVKAINDNIEVFPDYQWVKYKDMKRWADLQLKNQRANSVNVQNASLSKL